MSLLLMRPAVAATEPEKTRNKTGIKNIFDKAMSAGQKVTLEQALAILRAGW